LNLLDAPRATNADLDRLVTSEAPLSRESIETFLRGRSFPLVDGRIVTFVFHGRADGVALRHFIFGLPTSRPFTRVPGTDFFFHELELPRKSRVEYKLEIERGGDVQLITDPFNPHHANDPYGANSVCFGEGYEPPSWIRFDPEARRGTLETLTLKSQALGDERKVRVYLPARFRRRARYPLLIAHDGDDYLRFSGMQQVLDNLIHRLEIAPLIVAFANPGNRLTEYAADERHAEFLVSELLPQLDQRFPLIDRPSARGLLGASFGAVSTLFTAWRHPGTFGSLFLQSGSFGFFDIGGHQRGPLFDPVVRFVNEFRSAPGRPADRAFVSCGVYESLIYENRTMAPVLQSTGMDVKFVESRDGHNWENWRDRMREGLSWLFPGPLWLVYE
jgi:enterochelin esterase-like enzyme